MIMWAEKILRLIYYIVWLVIKTKKKQKNERKLKIVSLLKIRLMREMVKSHTIEVEEKIFDFIVRNQRKMKARVLSFISKKKQKYI